MRQTLETLNQDEGNMLLAIVNDYNYQNPRFSWDQLVYFKFKVLAKKVVDAKKNLTEDGRPVYIGLCEKLKIPTQ